MRRAKGRGMGRGQSNTVFWLCLSQRVQPSQQGILLSDLYDKHAFLCNFSQAVCISGQGGQPVITEICTRLALITGPWGIRTSVNEHREGRE